MSTINGAQEQVRAFDAALKSHLTKPTKASATALLEQWQELVLSLLVGVQRKPREPGSNAGPPRALFDVSFRSTGHYAVMDYDRLCVYLNLKRNTLQVKVSQGKGKLELVRPNPNMGGNEDCLTIRKMVGTIPDDIVLWEPPARPKSKTGNKMIDLAR